MNFNIIMEEEKCGEKAWCASARITKQCNHPHPYRLGFPFWSGRCLDDGFVSITMADPLDHPRCIKMARAGAAAQ